MSDDPTDSVRALMEDSQLSSLNQLIKKYKYTNKFKYTQISLGTVKWPCGTVPDLRSWVRIPPAAAVYQCQLSMPSLPMGSVDEYQQKLRSKSAYHVMH